jgi:peptidoglycan/xylan/chitin deacetylase (PgdA/CDA1 family)
MTRPTPVAITFEAGGDPAPARAMVRALADARVRATFFLDGRWAESHGDIVAEIVDQGHELGNHGYRHPDWTTLSDPLIEADLTATEDVARRLVGQTVKPWARPPYGGLDERVLGTLERLGYRAFYRDAVDGAHWPGETTGESICARALRAADEGGAIVLHTNNTDSALVLPGLLRSLREKGCEPVALSDLMSPPSARAPRHPDFASVEIRPGYVRPLVGGGRWHSVNLLEIGTGRNYPAGAPEVVSTLGSTVSELLVLDATEIDWGADTEDRRILVLEGEVRCEFAREQTELGYLIARTGDYFLCPAAVACRLSSIDGRRTVAMVWRGLDQSAA